MTIILLDAEAWHVLGNMLGDSGPEKLTYDWKAQLAALSGSCCDAGSSVLPALACMLPVLDIRIAAWLIKPDSWDASDNPAVTAVRSPQPMLGDLSCRTSCAIFPCRGSNAAHLSARRQ